MSIAPRHLVAPCGLDCSRCISCTEGRSVQLSRELLELLGENFHAYAARLQAINPALAEYPQFRRVLESLAQDRCGGCRSGTRVCLPSCNVMSCTSAKGVEFCFQCDEYPCTNTGLPEPVLKKWRTQNDRMREIGIDGYLRELAETPRYP
ncbi:DUF3795 domain-containing protein [Desulfovibrio subterraneus]|uniref:DUF3795 domain-containing protein n=1 Tax=Desulfovibrio subterraneus TaxID=2718620 RepID=UPI0022B91F9A|nr:DUF3795 domain-containing protein [Desulfovibrio subterraneus]WBF67030.1 DUF3795 domain-containing protein [Desulfovibrio subterraneus]